MLDTVAYKRRLKLKENDFNKAIDPVGFKRAVNNSQYYDTVINHELGLRLYCRVGFVNKIEADLPKLLFGHNGRLLLSLEEFEEALRRIDILLRSICEVEECFEQLENNEFLSSMLRVDLAWQFPISAAKLKHILFNAKHPKIRREAVAFNRSNFLLPGKSFAITAYDKVSRLASFSDMKEAALHTTPVTRVEVRFKQTSEVKNSQIFSPALSSNFLGHLWNAYRKALLPLEAQYVDTRGKGDMKALVALYTRFGQEAVDIFFEERDYSPQMKRKKIREFNTLLLASSSFSMKDILPTYPPIPEEISVASIENRKEALERAYGMKAVCESRIRNTKNNL